jgi:transcriptional regulator with XRE-family HTH domain
MDETRCERIRRLREGLGWCQDDLVEVAGLCRDTVHRAEYHPEANLTVETIRLLALALETTPEYLEFGIAKNV